MIRPAGRLDLSHEIIRVRGAVQGVGFRPTVWRLANEIGLTGTTLNDGEGVLIDAWGTDQQLDSLCGQLREKIPPLARIDAIERNPATPDGSLPASFAIVTSADGDVKTSIVADAGSCQKCSAEVIDPFNRRFRYPFTNCTDCGPRLSIIDGVPYDRLNTSMAGFEMCADCQKEYDDPGDRRFHAQPNACHVCGPQARLIRADGHAICTENLTQLDDVDAACSLLQKGEIVAVKGIGGFHLACDATNGDAVARLRNKKHRYAKPFALMATNIRIIREYCSVSSIEETLLGSPSAPIVILNRRNNQLLPEGIAPGQSTLGFMLPYTPLHHLLLRRMSRPVVLTSANVSDEPPCIDNDDAIQRLGTICEFLLIHNRNIVNRVDDSVVRVVGNDDRLLRRARGYAPAPIPLPPGFGNVDESVAMGGDLKNTFCLLKDGHAILSPHIGGLHDARTLAEYEKNLDFYGKAYGSQWQRVIVDLHPEYLSTKLGRKLAQDTDREVSVVQHHHAHIAACLGDNAWPLDGGKVLGVALDGLGLGNDGEWWGGEFLLADYVCFDRLATFKPVALPGNSQAMREPWRNTYAHIMAQMGWTHFKINFAELELCRYLESKPLDALNVMLRAGASVPEASSCGRLFDAVAAAMGICRDAVSYEGQAAIEMEALIDENCLANEADNLAYPFTLPSLGKTGLPYIEPLAMWSALFGDLILNTPVGVMAARFHKGLAKAIVHTVRVLARQHENQNIRHVALSGGVLQNKVLFEQLTRRLEAENFAVLTHRQVPANDGGLSLGQALVDAAQNIVTKEQ